MKKTIKKLTAVGLTLTSVMGLVAAQMTAMQQADQAQARK